MQIHDHNGQPYEADLVAGEKFRELERENADLRRTCAELVTDGNAVTLAQTVQRLSGENATLREKLDDLMTFFPTNHPARRSAAGVLVKNKP